MSVRSRRKRLTDSDRTKMRSFATQAVLEKTDRILGPKVSVRVESSNVSAPGYTDGKVIYINSRMEPIRSALSKGFDPKTMLLLTGLNYHELAHCLFTPRLTSGLVNNVRNEGAFMAFNILEDQSAETLFVKRYEPARHYFTALVTDYMMDDTITLSINYPLVSGRLFLPASLRRKFRESYRYTRIVDDIDRLVAEYKTLVYPSDKTRMYNIIIEFQRLLDSVKPPTIETPHKNFVEGDVADETERRQIVEVDEFINDDEDDEQEASLGEEDEDESEETEEGVTIEEDGEGSDDESVSDDSSDNDSDDSGTTSDEPGDTDGDEESSDEGEPSEATESGDGDGGSAQSYKDLKSQPQKRREMFDSLEEAFNESLEEVEHELDDRIHSVQEEERNYQVSKDPTNPRYVPVKPEHHALVNKCVDEFAQAKVQRMPGWHRRQRHGKLDPKRYAKALKGYDDVFKRWREGVNDIVEFEAVFLLDQSGSMSSRMERASTALWVLRRTFEEHDGTTTVLGFEDHLHLLSQRGDTASRTQIPMYRHHGGTKVGNALTETRRILTTSRKAMKLCVIVSDGGFHDTERAQNVIHTMGEPVTIVGLDIDVSVWKGERNIIHQQTITDPMELVEVVKNLALNLSDEYAKGRGQ